MSYWRSQRGNKSNLARQLRAAGSYGPGCYGMPSFPLGESFVAAYYRFREPIFLDSREGVKSAWACGYPVFSCYSARDGEPSDFLPKAKNGYNLVTGEEGLISFRNCCDGVALKVHWELEDPAGSPPVQSLVTEAAAKLSALIPGLTVDTGGYQLQVRRPAYITSGGAGASEMGYVHSANQFIIDNHTYDTADTVSMSYVYLGGESVEEYETWLGSFAAFSTASEFAAKSRIYYYGRANLALTPLNCGPSYQLRPPHDVNPYKPFDYSQTSGGVGYIYYFATCTQGLLADLCAAGEVIRCIPELDNLITYQSEYPDFSKEVTPVNGVL